MLSFKGLARPVAARLSGNTTRLLLPAVSTSSYTGTNNSFSTKTPSEKLFKSRLNDLPLTGCMTKVVCTIGPATDSVEHIQQLVDHGMSVARLNFSHAGDDYSYPEQCLQRIRDAHGKHHALATGGATTEQAGILPNNVRAVLVDTKGPEIRTGPLQGGVDVAEIQLGDRVDLTTKAVEQDPAPDANDNHHVIHVDYQSIAISLEAGKQVLLDDGLIALEVLETDPSSNTVICTALNGGPIKKNKGVNLPDTVLDLPALTDKDKRDLKWACTVGADFVAASFIRTAANVRAVIAYLDRCISEMPPLAEGPRLRPLVISKIESKEGVDNFDEILEASDGIMVARGDLGVEIPYSKVFKAQKMMVKKCQQIGKSVIVATQMLDSMQTRPRPTRAEVTDVGTAVLDGTDATMLSGETAAGKYPLEALRSMTSVVWESDQIRDVDRKRMWDEERHAKMSQSDQELDAVAASAVGSAKGMGARCIVLITQSGRVARAVARHQPTVPVLAFCTDVQVARRLQLYRSIVPLMLQSTSNPKAPTTRFSELRAEAVRTAMELGFVEDGDRIIMVDQTQGTAVLEGIDGTVLSGETAAGRKKRFPPFYRKTNWSRPGLQLLFSARIPQPQQQQYSWRTWSSSPGTFPASEVNNTPYKVRSMYDASDHWEDWFPPEEYGNAWERSAKNNAPQDKENTVVDSTVNDNNNSNTNASANKTLEKRRPMLLEELVGEPELDMASRHLIHQMQLLYHDRFSSQGEVITSHRCYQMITQLLQSAKLFTKKSYAEAHGFGDDNGALPMRQRVFRAEAVLRSMEMFWDFVPDLIEDTHPQRRILKTSSVEGTMIKPAVKWPLPTYEIYVQVLRALSNLRAPKQYQTTVQNSDVAWTCQSVMLRLHRFHQTKGFVYLKKPPPEAWNQVLAAWANSHGDRDHPEKALHATQFFMDTKLLYHVEPDPSAYSHVMRACAHHDRNALAQELGAKVAIKFWNGHMKDQLELQSFTPTPQIFVFFMRAIAGLPETKEVEKYLKEAWEAACIAGVVNEHVLYELEMSSSQLFQELIKEHQDKIDTKELEKLGPKTAYDKRLHEAILAILPENWKRNSHSSIASSE